MNSITSFCRIRNNRFTTEQLVIEHPAASKDEFSIGLYERLQLNYPKFYKMDQQCRLGYIASELVLKGVDVSAYADSFSLVLSNADGSLDTDLRFQQSISSVASPSLFVYTLPSMVAGEICIRHKIKGENAFFVTPSFNAELLIEYVDSLLAGPGDHACLAGWVNVLDAQHDILLYLVENRRVNGSRAHNMNELNKLYGQ
ncbi:MAG TPA: hypothetical protein VD927_08870 [Chryseosolibacter sp.]|nr:hypothetical protein [Chryseosolibacter sp.]